MDNLLASCFIVCPLLFAAGFVDSIAGGGGLISLPAFLIAGLPAHNAMATNKLTMSTGTLIASVKYIKAGRVNIKAGLFSSAGSFAGAYAGSSLALLISQDTLKIILLCILPAVAVFLLVNKKFGKEKADSNQINNTKLIPVSLAIGIVIGCYDGLIGPGTGTFLILAFTALLGFDLITSSGCAKIANLASNIASSIVFIINGKVFFALALPAAIFAMAGSYTGAKIAVKNGSKVVRTAILFVIAILFAKTVADLLF